MDLVTVVDVEYVIEKSSVCLSLSLTGMNLEDTMREKRFGFDYIEHVRVRIQINYRKYPNIYIYVDGNIIRTCRKKQNIAFKF